MEITLKLFGITKDIYGKTEDIIKLEGKPSVSVFLENMKIKFPGLADLSSILVAVNNEYAEPDMVLADNDEVALIPPVSGG